MTEYAPVRMPWASRIAAAMRTVELLPLVPTTWIERNACCGLPSTVSRRRMRSSPNFIPNSSSESRWSSALLERPAHPSASSSACSRASLSRSAWTTGGGAFVDEALVGELALGALDLTLEPRALGRGALRLGLGVDRVGGEHRHVAARDGDGRDRGRAVLGPLDAAQARDRVGGALVALGLEPRLERAPGRGADAVAPRAQLLDRADRAGELGLGGLVDERLVGRRPRAGHQQVLAARQVRPDLLGHERDHRVGERERLAQHVQRDRARPRRCRPRTAAA